MKGNKPILLVEDDKVDAMTVARALREVKVTNPLSTVYDGVEALEYLRDPSKDRPCVILLDLNMPRMSGTEFLKVMKQDPDIKAIPVVVLTTSQHEQDRTESFALGVAGYMVKPIDYQQFVEVLRTVSLYWTLSELPPSE